MYLDDVDVSVSASFTIVIVIASAFLCLLGLICASDLPVEMLQWAVTGEGQHALLLRGDGSDPRRMLLESKD